MRRIVVGDVNVGFVDVLAAFVHDEPDLEVVGRATTAGELISALQTQRPDVVVVDVRLLQPSFMRSNTVLHDASTFVVVASVATQADRRRAERLGARLVMKADAPDLLASIRSAVLQARAASPLSPLAAWS